MAVVDFTLAVAGKGHSLVFDVFDADSASSSGAEGPPVWLNESIRSKFLIWVFAARRACDNQTGFVWQERHGG
jgi:hypothetical protein